jgi:putative acetyltransferase
MKNMYKLDVPEKSEYPDLLKVWESSVRATHHFLKEEEIVFLKKLILDKNVFDLVELIVARNNNNDIVGIMGVSGDDLAMLFVEAEYIGKGVGRFLIEYSIRHFGIKHVDVNEQNEQALNFYKHFGFRVISRSDLDDYGQPYPILHMQLA